MLVAEFCQCPLIKGVTMNEELLAASALLVQSGALFVNVNIKLA
jgi:hypothetical protein